MRLRNDSWYQSDEGKWFVLTELGKAEVASFKSREVGQPIGDDDYDSTRATGWMVNGNYVEEVPIPDWVEKPGYRVGYYNGEYFLSAGNPMVFPKREMAEKYAKNYAEHPWFNEDLVIVEDTYKGRELKPCEFYKGKRVHNKSWYYGVDALEVGDLVTQDIADDLINVLPPKTWNANMFQVGEPNSTRVTEDGESHTTWTTFKRIAEGIWEYCGDCFARETVQRGKRPLYV